METTTSTCDLCGSSKNEDASCCIFCWFSGRYFETVLLSDERDNMLDQIRALPQVKRAEVWHQGGSSFALAVELNDGRIMLPGVPVEFNGVKGSFPAIPVKGDPWVVAVVQNQNTDEDLTLMADEFDDVGVVQAVREVSELGAALA